MNNEEKPIHDKTKVDCLVDQILNYVRKPNPDYALMINGPWGCGKTFFVKNRLASSLRKGTSLTYISLHGVKSFRELDVRMLLGQAQWTKSLPASTIDWISSIPTLAEDGPLISRLLVGLIPSLNGLWKWITRKLKFCCSSKKSCPPCPELIVVDDLERISDAMSIKDILGYFSTHFISVGKHVVFVCDETQSTLSSEDYRTTREKYVRRILSFPGIDDEMLSQLIKARCSDPSIECAVKNILPSIADFIRRHNIKNLRTVSLFVDGYSDLVRGLSDSEFLEKAGHAIVERLFPLYNEIALGKLSADNLSNHAGLDNLDSYRFGATLAKLEGSSKQIENEETKDYPSEFLERYDGVFTQWIFRHEVFRFALTNEFDPESFKQDFADVCRELSGAERALEAVRNYYFLDEDDLLPQVQTCLCAIDTNKFGFQDLSTLSFCFSMIDKQNYLSETEWKQGLDARMLSAVDHVPGPKSLEEAEELYDAWIRAPFHELVAGSLQQTILTRIKERVRSFLVSKRSEALSEIFDSLQNKREPTDTYVRGRFSDSLLSDIVSFGMQERVAELSTFGLRWMEHYIQRSYLDRPASPNPQTETKTAAAEIARTVNARLSKGDLTVARKTRLTEFADKLAQLGKHLNNQPPQETH